MTKIALLSASLAATLVALLPAAPAQATIFHTYVSSTGSGAVCSITAPCQTFQAAHDNTDSGGEISCLDGGDQFTFGYTTINRSINIDCAGTAAVSIGFAINGPGHVVTIRNLTINGILNGGGLPGIDFISARTLVVENCTIVNWINSSTFMGIRFRPLQGSHLVVNDSSFINNGIGSTGGGIVVRPQVGGTAQVALTRVNVSNGVFGIVADGTGSTGGINMTINDSVAASNSQDGILAVTPGGGAPIGVMVKNTRSANNNIGIRSLGPNVTIRVDGSSITGNGTGLSFGSGGALLSYGNNNVDANGANGAFSGPVTLK